MRTDVEGRLRFRLTFSDVDLVQFFFADYYRWMDRAMAELMAACGYPRAASFEEGIAFPVVESGCVYKERAVIDEQLEITGRFADMTKRSFRIGYEFTKLDGTLIAEGFTQHVCVSVAEMQSCPVPQQFRAQGGEA